jgi:hypothetical protein
MGSRRQKRGRVAFLDSAKAVERGSSKEKEMMEGEVVRRLSTASSRRRRMRWFADVDLITRQAYERAIMSGHGMLLLLSSSRTV